MENCMKRVSNDWTGWRRSEATQNIYRFITFFFSSFVDIANRV